VLSPLTVGKSIALRLMTIVMMLPGLITHAFLLVATLPEFHTWTAALMFSTLVWYGAAINLMVGARTKIVEEQLS
jgi:thiosulfate reductase cytochrome b subunit